MKYIYLFLLAIAPFLAEAQKSDKPVIGRVIYNFSHVRDTANRNQVYTEDMALFFSTDATLYRSYKLMYNDSVTDATLAEQIRSGGIKNARTNVVRGTHEQIFHFYSPHDMISVNPWLGDSLVIYTKIDTIAWRIVDSTRLIGGYTCQKATGRYKGREYDAWFCADFAVTGGPWKLQGLPGLILEAYDKKKDVMFTFSSFQNTPKSRLIALPANTRKVTNIEFTKMKDAVLQDPSGYISAALNGKGSENGSNTSSSLQLKGLDGKPRTPKKINNPLEIIE